MAHKSKTQRAKASAARQQRKADKAEAPETAAADGSGDDAKPALTSHEKPKKRLSIFGKSDDEQLKAEKRTAEKAAAKKARFKFLKDVRAEMRRVTWPSRPDVLRWTGVVVLALLFFGVFVAALDNLIVTPLLVAVSDLGA